MSKDLHHRDVTSVIKSILRLIGIYVTCIAIMFTMEFFVIRNGVSKLIGSQTSFWWLGTTLGIVSVFMLIYLVFSLTAWLFHKIHKELDVD